jgi:hypothetical protein
MKITMLVGCLALGVAGCATERGGVNTPYTTDYGDGPRASSTYWRDSNSIYPVRKQPSINGADMGGVRPLIDPSRQEDVTYSRSGRGGQSGWVQRETGSDRSADWTYDRDYPPRAVSPRDSTLR